LTGARKHLASGDCVEVTVLAGIAQGEPITELDSVIESAKVQQKEIGRLQCAAEE
jgi:phospholipid/cholesterol/gamma-HCH transport system ATP-binding protein